MTDNLMTDPGQAPKALRPGTTESVSETYLRHIRNAVVILAVLALLSALGGVITGIAVAVHAHDVNVQQQENNCIQNLDC